MQLSAEDLAFLYMEMLEREREGQLDRLLYEVEMESKHGDAGDR